MMLARDDRSHDRDHALEVANACLSALDESLVGNTLAGTVLVAECGPAQMVVQLANRHPGVERVMACEPDLTWLAEARAACTFRSPRVHFSPKGWRDGGFAASVFSASACLGGLGGALDARDAVGALSRSTAPDGLVVVAVSGTGDAPLWQEILAETASARGLADVVADAKEAAWTEEHRKQAAVAADIEWNATREVSREMSFANADAYLQSSWIQTINRSVWRPLAGQELIDAAERRLRTYFAASPVVDHRVTRCDVGRVADATLEVADVDLIVE